MQSHTSLFQTIRRSLSLGLAPILLVTNLSVAQEIPTASPESVGMSTERLARIGTAMQRYIDADLTPGIATAIIRKGKLVHFQVQGDMDVANATPLREDAIFRIASMTKPIASVALMMLWEEGHFQLRDPVAKFIPAFTDIKVQTEDGAVAPKRPIQIRDMFTHTAGLANSYLGDTKTYQEVMQRAPRPRNNAEVIARLTEIPLNYHPGEAWQYSIATDVIGRLVEVISGQSLDEFLRDRIFIPLDMPDSGFYLDADATPRLTSQYRPGDDKTIVLADPGNADSYWISGPRTRFSGSGGMVSTVRDYLRFQQAILNGGELYGSRILAPSTVSLMLENHTGDLPLWLTGPGTGFGLGYGVIIDRGAAATPLSMGAAYWGGAYCTLSWLDPEQELVAVLMTQVRPYNHINVRADFQVLTYQAIIDN